jgi:tight adherence protein B
MDNATLVAAISAGVLVLAVFAFGVLFFVRRRAVQTEVIKQRLTTPGPQTTKRARTLRLWHEGQEATTVVVGEEVVNTPWQRFLQLRADAGFTTPPETLALIVMVVAVVLAGGLLLFTGRIVPAAFGFVMVPFGFWWFASMRVARRAAVFERQLVDGLELSSRALRAGHPLTAAFQLIADEIPPPVGLLFAEICQQQALGVRMEDALRRTASQTKSDDLKLFAAAMAIHLRSGGNLADVMQGLAYVIRERLRLGRRFRVLIAQTQVSKRILLGMPVIMFGVLNIIGPEYMGTMYAETYGQMLLLVAGMSMIIGWIVMNKMATLKV